MCFRVLTDQMKLKCDQLFSSVMDNVAFILFSLDIFLHFFKQTLFRPTNTQQMAKIWAQTDLDACWASFFLNLLINQTAFCQIDYMNLKIAAGCEILTQQVALPQLLCNSMHLLNHDQRAQGSQQHEESLLNLSTRFSFSVEAKSEQCSNNITSFQRIRSNH